MGYRPAMKNIQAKLINWYQINKRSLPWRSTKNPYHIWLSEIILQQTRVAQGLPYYEKFVQHFPTVQHLANAHEDEVLKLWQGLGYYSRARNLHASAKYVTYDLNGAFPDNYDDLLQLKGVGDYTASAISSFCYNEQKAVLDGNVFRFLARFFGVETPINSTAGKKEFSLLSKKLLNLKDPATHNQAIMEFGANQCKPKNPDCTICVFNDKCVALQLKKVDILPKKDKKIKIKNRYFNYIIPLIQGDKTVLQKRTQNGIWKNLYEFPLIESSACIDGKEASTGIKALNLFPQKNTLSKYNEKPIVHKLSHQHIYTTFWILETDQAIPNTILIADIKKYAVSTLLSNFMNEFKFFRSNANLTL